MRRPSPLWKQEAQNSVKVEKLLGVVVLTFNADTWEQRQVVL